MTGKTVRLLLFFGIMGALVTAFAIFITKSINTDFAKDAERLTYIQKNIPAGMAAKIVNSSGGKYYILCQPIANEKPEFISINQTMAVVPYDDVNKIVYRCGDQ